MLRRIPRRLISSWLQILIHQHRHFLSESVEDNKSCRPIESEPKPEPRTKAGSRRPLAACRAVLFAQLVDDPSAHPDQFPTEKAQDAERQRLFGIIERLVRWENSTNEKVLEEARTEIRSCFPDGPPAVLDPFAGGGSIPLEAQRLARRAQPTVEAHLPEKPAPSQCRHCMAAVPVAMPAQPSLTTSWAISSLRNRGRSMSGNVVLFVGGLGVAVNVAVLWLSLRMARRASCEFDNRR